MKTIGLVGGMTPESTKAYYELLIEGARQPGGDPLRNPEILIYSLNLTELVQIQRTGDREDGGRLPLRHYRAPPTGRRGGWRPHSGTPLTPTWMRSERRPRFPWSASSRQLGMLPRIEHSRPLSSWGPGRPWRPRCTHASFARPECGVVLPGENDREFLDHTIYNDLALGKVTPEIRKRYLDICTRHIENDGIDSVILGCTELPLVISSDDLPVQVLDTTTLHVAAILAAAS